jgi:hypothetical protein
MKPHVRNALSGLIKITAGMVNIEGLGKNVLSIGNTDAIALTILAVIQK